MKIYKYILGALLLSGLALPLTNVRAQDVHLKCLEWNVKALEFSNNSNVSKEIGRFVTLIREQNAEIVFFNEFETLSGAMFLKEKANEFAKELGMYSFFIHSYNKRGNDGYYGNVILPYTPRFVGQSHAENGRNGRRTMSRAECIVRTFVTSRESRYSAVLPQVQESIPPASEYFVGVSLMADIPHERFVRGIEYIMQGYCQLHNPQIGAQVSLPYRNHVYDITAELGRELFQCAQVHTTYVHWRIHGKEQGVFFQV